MVQCHIITLTSAYVLAKAGPENARGFHASNYMLLPESNTHWPKEAMWQHLCNFKEVGKCNTPPLCQGRKPRDTEKQLICLFYDHNFVEYFK